jgi:hypothetical protein
MPKIKIISVFTFVILFSVIPTSSFSQKTKGSRLKVANNDSKIIPDSSKSYSFYSADAYFSANGLPNTKVGKFFGHNLIDLMKLIDSSSNGAIVTLDNVRFINAKGESKSVTEIPYKFNKNQCTDTYVSKAVQEVRKLLALDFVSGTIYFSGTNFINVISATPKGINSLKSYYDRCGPGSIITLDNCIYKNFNGTFSKPISKSLKLE